MKDFRQLKVWEKSHLVTLKLYKATVAFPRTELYGLTNQIRRAAASVPANIAEGCGRGSPAEFLRFSESQWDRLPNWIITFSSRETSVSWQPRITPVWRRMSNEVQRMLAAPIRKLEVDRLS